MAEDLSSKATDFMKKVLTAGISTVFLTEEGIRNLVSELKLPKELIGTLLESASRTRREFLQNLSNEMIEKIMEKVNPAELAQEIIEKNHIEIQVKLVVSPKNKTPKTKSRQ